MITTLYYLILHIDYILIKPFLRIIIVNINIEITQKLLIRNLIKIHKKIQENHPLNNICSKKGVLI